MPQTLATPPRHSLVRVFAPGWDGSETMAHAGDLQAMERYVRAAALGQGLSDSEMGEDLNGRFGALGAISVTRTASPGGGTFWIEIAEA